MLENSAIRCVRGCVPILRGEKEKGNDRKNDRKKDRDEKEIEQWKMRRKKLV